eukprot:TRINITY_DN6264_c0_g1_i2.p2 TRINITY_DN6264_c0_g1~~TRINITY_DN6264_c0_g1_i2.p2  ORF type:complete len:329 (-),score=96.17 TRINITY_DN6264_c0_g1_i2:108-1094(-)
MRRLEEDLGRLRFNAEGVENPARGQWAGSLSSIGKDLSKGAEDFFRDVRIEVKALSKEAIEFDVIGIDAAIANALRRIMISEIATMAIERVVIYQNTSPLPDEVLAHRLGLIPLRVDPSKFVYKREEEDHNERNSLKFVVKSENRDEAPSTVYASALKWVPLGSQAKTMEEPRPVHEKIIVTRLAQNQEFEAELLAEKGIGRTHAKWSPVATAFYRLMPDIVLREEVKGEAADRLVKTCPMGVYDIEDLGKGLKRATVARPRDCTMCRECIRPEEFAPIVDLGKRRDHFIFVVESTGVIPPEEIFREALRILKDKAVFHHKYIDENLK